LARLAAGFALAKIGHDIVALDMSRVVSYTDLFLLVTGQTTRQTHAVSEAIQRGLREHGVRPTRVEGERSGDWILLDYLDIVVHVFTPESRQFYRLEQLWGDVPQLAVTDDNVDSDWSFGGDDDEASGQEIETA
jgi:ribosome-associated protein